MRCKCWPISTPATASRKASLRSPVSVICAEFARTLGFEVIVCDPREEAYGGFDLPGVEEAPEDQALDLLEAIAGGDDLAADAMDALGVVSMIRVVEGPVHEFLEADGAFHGKKTAAVPKDRGCG